MIQSRSVALSSLIVLLGVWPNIILYPDLNFLIKILLFFSPLIYLFIISSSIYKSPWYIWTFFTGYERQCNINRYKNKTNGEFNRSEMNKKINESLKYINKHNYYHMTNSDTYLFLKKKDAMYFKMIWE